MPDTLMNAGLVDESAPPGLGWYLGAIRRRLWLVVLVTLCGVGLAVAYLFVATPKYTANATIGPAETGGSAGGLSALSVLASTAGVILPTAEATSFDRFQQLIFSPVVAQRLIDTTNVPQVVFKNEWDAATGTWHPSAGAVQTAIRSVIEFFGIPAWRPPDAARLATYLENNVQVLLVGTTAFRELTYEHEDPAFAVRLLTALYRETEDIVVDQAAQETGQNIVYLRERLMDSQILDQRTVLMELMSRQETQMLLIQSRNAYASQLIVVPYTGQTPTSPQPIRTLAMGGAGGAMVGIVLAILFGSRRRR